MPSRNKTNGVRGAKSRRSSGREQPTVSAKVVEERIASENDADLPHGERRRQPRGRRKSPRTASGKRSDPQLLAAAALEAQEYLRERTEAGHRAAGRTPPSEKTPARASGATRIIDDAIRSFAAPVTEDEKLLQQPSEAADFTRTDPWRVLRIMGEFIEGFDNLATVTKGVTIFGSARTHPDDPQYQLAQETARLLAEQGFAIITGAGPGIMEAANRGAEEGGGKTVGLNIGLPFEQFPNAYITPSLSFEFHYFFMRKLWFAHLARALVIFPGGFGTLDEMMEMLTLMQTEKIDRRIPVLLYGTAYWKDVISFDALVRHGMIDPADLTLFKFADDPADALALLQTSIEAKRAEGAPAIAHSRTQKC